jgi:hypothetical protein
MTPSDRKRGKEVTHLFFGSCKKYSRRHSPRNISVKSFYFKSCVIVSYFMWTPSLLLTHRFICFWKLSTIAMTCCCSLRRCSPHWAQVASFLCLDHTHLDTDTHQTGLLYTSDQLYADATTYTTHNKPNWQAYMPSTGLESGIPAIKRL